jgi:hypothetical protein
VQCREQAARAASPTAAILDVDSDAIRTVFRGDAGRGSGVKPDIIPI